MAPVIIVFAVGAAINLSVYLLYNYFGSLSSQVQRTGQILQFQMALDGMVDYVSYGVKRQWCFDTTMLRDPNCDLTHDGNSERLLLSNAVVASIVARKAGGLPQGDPVRLKSIVRTVSLSSITNSHPLYTMVEHLRLVRYDSVTSRIVSGLEDEVEFLIERIDNLSFPVRGSEVFLRIRASIGVKSGFAMISAGKIFAESVVGVFPRELGTFALMVPNDLRLDKISEDVGGPIPAKGDVHFHLFSDRVSAKQTLGSIGLLFDSPIFVNGNLHLPSTQNATSPYADAVNHYSAVTFNDQVVLGGGVVLRDGLPFSPVSAGGADSRFNQDISSIGGLKRGTLIDGQRDLGLDVLADPLLSANPDRTNMNICIARNAARSSLRATSKSATIIRQTAPPALDSVTNTVTHSYKLALSQSNALRQISGSPSVTSSSGNVASGTSMAVTGTSTSPIMKARVRLGPLGSPSHDYEVELGLESSYTLKPRFVNMATSGCGGGRTYFDVTNTACPAGNPVGSRARYCSTTGMVDAFQCGPVATPATTCGGGFNHGQLRKVSCGADFEGAILERCTNGVVSEFLNTCQKFTEISLVTSAYKPISTANKQDNQVNLEIKFKNPADFPNVPNFDFNLYEAGADFNTGTTLRTFAKDTAINRGDGTFAYDTKAEITFTPNATGPQATTDFSLTDWKVGRKINRDHATYSTISGPIDETKDYVAIDTACSAGGGVGGGSFGLADWDFSFSGGTETSWDFALYIDPSTGLSVPGPQIYNFDAGNSASPNIVFQVRSLMDECKIKSDAVFVTGFYNCKRLTIDSRTTPLRIIGTFIATEIDINPEAIKAGIQWSTIYHPQAIRELRAQEILKANPGYACDSLLKPIWHPYPDVFELASQNKCSPSSLRAKAQPFTWTTVDPDCGLVSGAAVATTCKNRPVRFNLQEISRRGSR